ncbi:restriction endonuclease [Mesorhizobium sp. M0622]|uniref:restriction endonuclease n=1 Tax=unclassified Mesorhizobium TaxID=325217 RepID=UPI00333B6AD2
MSGHEIRTFADISPLEFENFTYDILSAGGMRHLTWRTPGADGGRDLEGDVFTCDYSGFTNRERWYVECKRYAASLDWPLIYGKIAHADTNRADFLLVVTNSNPSPACETQISIWNEARRSPRIRVWRGYELHVLANRFPAIAAKYGLRPSPDSTVAEFLDLALEISKISQAAYAAVTLGTDATPAIEASSALSELFSVRARDMAEYGRFIPLPLMQQLEIYPWVRCGQAIDANDVAIRASLSTFRLITGALSLQLERQGGWLVAIPDAVRIKIGSAGNRLMSVVAIWSDLELVIQVDQSLRISKRK